MKPCANSDLQTVNAQDTPRRDENAMKARHLSMKMDDASRSIHGDAECLWLDRRHHLKLAMNPNERLETGQSKDHETQSPRKVSRHESQAVPTARCAMIAKSNDEVSGLQE